MALRAAESQRNCLVDVVGWTQEFVGSAASRTRPATTLAALRRRTLNAPMPLTITYYDASARARATAVRTKDDRKRGRRQTLRGGSLRARLNGPARVGAWWIGY